MSSTDSADERKVSLTVVGRRALSSVRILCEPVNEQSIRSRISRLEHSDYRRQRFSRRSSSPVEDLSCIYVLSQEDGKGCRNDRSSFQDTAHRLGLPSSVGGVKGIELGDDGTVLENRGCQRRPYEARES